MSKIQALQKSYGIALLYVGLATVAIFSTCGNATHDFWVSATLLITLPVNFISAGIIHTNSDAYLQVLIVQTMVLLVTGLWIYIVVYQDKIKC